MKIQKQTSLFLIIPIIILGLNINSVSAETQTNPISYQFTTAYFKTEDCLNCDVTMHFIDSAVGFRFYITYKAIYDGSTTDAYIEFTNIRVEAATNFDTSLPLGPQYGEFFITISYQKPDNSWVWQEYLENGNEHLHIPQVTPQDDWARYMGWPSHDFTLENTRTDYKLKGGTFFYMDFFWHIYGTAVTKELSIQMHISHFMWYGWSAYDFVDIVYYNTLNDAYYGRYEGESSLIYFGPATKAFPIPAYPSGGGGGGGGGRV